jgi:WD40 repeat protein
MSRREPPAGLTSIPERLSERGPFVGRKRELDWLDVLWRRAVDGEHVTAVVSGPQGIGKTRLVREFARRVAAAGAVVDFGPGTGPGSIIEAPTLRVIEAGDHPDPGALTMATAEEATFTVMLVRRNPSGAGHHLELTGLSHHDVAALLADGVGDQPSELVDGVIAETGGIPSLVLEVAQRLRERDVSERVERALRHAELARGQLHSAEEDLTRNVARMGGTGWDTPGSPAAVVCPYKGLARFDTADADYFFGRERLVATLVARLAVSRFVGVVGASGSGKSSVIRAGLVAALRAGALPGSTSWPVVACTPGEQPLQSLAAAVAPAVGTAPAKLAGALLDDPEELARMAVDWVGPEGRLLVVVDQLEELTTACRDPQQRQAFAASLVDAVNPPDRAVMVIAVIRADYYGALAALPDLARLFADSQVVVGAMTDAELHRAVIQPAHRVGLRLEAGLADAICRDAAGEPGALPLVSTALLETWVRRQRDTLTIAGYQEVGGVRGAVARLAEDVYAALDEHGRQLARRVFLRLAEPGEGAVDLRRRVARSQLPPGDDAETVVAALVQRRLLVVDDASFEVAHEALLREWPRLRVWLDEDREGRRLHHQLTEAASRWESDGLDHAALYRGTRLAAAQEWVSVHPDDAEGLELQFVDASLAEQDAELRAARGAARRLRRLSIGVALIAVVALLAGGIALVQRSNADRKAAVARRAATAADAGRLAARAQALPASQLDLAMLLAVQGRHLQESATTDGALEAVLVHTPPGLDQTVELGAPAVCGQLSLDGRFVAAGTVDGYTHLIDVTSGRTLRTFPNIVGSRFCPALAFSADGNRLVACGTTGNVVVWDTATGRQIVTIKLPAASIRYPTYAFEPRPGRLVTSTGDGTVILWNTTDVARPTRAAVFKAPATEGVFAAVELADAAAPNRIAISSFTQTDVWKIATHTRAYPSLPGRAGPESPDGSTLVTQTATRFLFWDVTTGKARGAPLAGIIPDPSWPAVFNADGTRLAVLDRTTHTVMVVDLATRRLLASIPVAGFGGPGPFLKDGRLSVFAGQNMTLWRIGVDSPAPFATPIGQPGTPGYAYFTSDGSKVLTLGPNGLQTWDPTTGAALPALLGGRFDAPTQIDNPVWPTFSPEGDLIAWGSRDGTVTLWDGTNGQRLGVLASGTTNFDVAWAPRGHVLAVGGPGGRMTLWGLADPGHPVRLAHMTAPGFPPAVTPRPLFSPDGRLVAAVPISTVAFSAQLSLFDVSTGRPVRTIRTATGLVDSADFSPDSRTLATNVWDLGSGTSRIILWDVATGAARTTLFVPYITGGVAFVAGGRWLATPQLDTGAAVNGEPTGSAQVDIWDATTLLTIGEPLLVPGDAALLLETGLAPYRLAMGTTSPNGTPTILDLDPAHWQTMACAFAGRNLTHAEWNQYLPGRPYQTTCPQWPAGT